MEAIIIVGIILIVIVLIARNNKNKSQKQNFQNTVTAKIESDKKVQNASSINEKLIYKSKGVKSFEMRGMYFRDLGNKEVGKFLGTAICDYNEHDQSAVAIYNDSGVQLGFVPKGNKRLHDSIEKWHNSKVFAWGELLNEEYNGNTSWYGKVYIPVGYSENEISQIKEIFNLQERRKQILNSQNVSSEEYFSLLTDYRLISQYRKSLENIDGIDFDFPKTIIPSLSKQLEAEKDWNQLVMLEEFSDLIKLLNEKYANATLTRIEKAKKTGHNIV